MKTTKDQDADEGAANALFPEKALLVSAVLTSYVMRHRISDEGTTDLFNMLNAIYPGKAPRSKYLLKKALGADVREPEKHFYCVYYTIKGALAAPCKGVTGPCLAMTLPRFDVVDVFIPDYQHCACLGVMRQLLKLWLKSKHHKCDWYIGTRTSELNSLLLAITPPTEITRTPRKFEDMLYWKASEMRALLLFYGYVVLKRVLPLVYFKHFTLLSYGVYLFLKAEITKQDIREARALLEKFVVQMGVLYTARRVA
ncbi:hypothetical protein HPB48_019562 [Haemaphysalis longicornis]|uniref:Uncharacterized protein n=1 Tax=Haemaphysalis longicornis TaxID=44386 RepID=A0A9J6FC59_HAELO|nr:hypothetical protein HPB48_019562 [Haemaphysalis longicornis]